MIFLNRKFLAIVGIVVVVVVVVLLLLYLFVFRGGPTPVTLKSAVEVLEKSQNAKEKSNDASRNSVATGEVTWSVDASQDVFVGYRVNEELVGKGAFTAIGRTDFVSGFLVIDGENLLEATFEADLSKLKSDNIFRDGALRTQAIESAKYPKTRFTLIEPIILGTGLFSGEPVSILLKGMFNLHDITREIEITVDGQFVNDTLVVTSSFTILFSDYGIEKPSSGRVLSIEDHGIVEIQLFFIVE